MVAPASVEPRQAAMSIATANGICLKPSSMPPASGEATNQMIIPSKRLEMITPPTARMIPYSRKPRMERMSVSSPALNSRIDRLRTCSRRIVSWLNRVTEGLISRPNSSTPRIAGTPILREKRLMARVPRKMPPMVTITSGRETMPGGTGGLISADSGP